MKNINIVKLQITNPINLNLRYICKRINEDENWVSFEKLLTLLRIMFACTFAQYKRPTDSKEMEKFPYNGSMRAMMSHLLLMFLQPRENIYAQNLKEVVISLMGYPVFDNPQIVNLIDRLHDIITVEDDVRINVLENDRLRKLILLDLIRTMKVKDEGYSILNKAQDIAIQEWILGAMVERIEESIISVEDIKSNEVSPVAQTQEDQLKSEADLAERLQVK